MDATVLVTVSAGHPDQGLGTATLDTGEKITASQARRLACEATIIPVVLDGDSNPSTSPAANASTPPPCTKEPSSATAAAPPKAATGHPACATCTTRPPGPKAAAPSWRTAACCAPTTTTASTTPPTTPPSCPNGTVRFHRRT